MKHAALLVALCASSLAAVRPALAVSLAPAQAQRVSRGEIVTLIEESQDAVKTVTSVGMVDRSARDVYLLTTDLSNYPRIYNGIEGTTIESEGPAGIVASFRLKLPWPLPGRSVSTVTSLEPERLAFSWRRKDGSIKVYEGRVTIMAVEPRRSLVTYSAKVDPGFDWLPSWFVTWAQTSVLPSVILAIRDTLARRQGPYWQAGVSRPAFDEEPD